MRVSYSDRQISHQNVCHLFKNVHPEINHIVKFTVYKLVNKLKETGHVKDITNRQQMKLKLSMY